MKHNATTLSWMGALTLMVFVLFNTGCSKDFLDRDPYIGSSAGNFYQTAEDAEAATIACYAPLQVEISDGAHFRWYFGDIVSDDADKGGSGDTDEPDLLEFEGFYGDPSSGIVLGRMEDGLQRHHVLQPRFGEHPWHRDGRVHQARIPRRGPVLACLLVLQPRHHVRRCAACDASFGAVGVCAATCDRG